MIFNIYIYLFLDNYLFIVLLIIYNMDNMLNIIKDNNRQIELWNNFDIYNNLIQRNKLNNGPYFNLMNGPAFVSGKPHYGHCLVTCVKDIINKYYLMNGYNVDFQLNFDCHGIAIEMLVNKELDINKDNTIENYGIDKYNNYCCNYVNNNTAIWKPFCQKIGQFVNFDDHVKTMDTKFMQSVWWIFNNLYNNNLIYRGNRILAYSTDCATPLSNFEASLNYKEHTSKTITVLFKINELDNTYIAAWTTTPWTLPSNQALCVNSDFTYNIYYDSNKDRNIIMLKYDYDIIVNTIKGSELTNFTYTPLFNYNTSQNVYKIISDPFVSDIDGTGIVHIAPAFGNDDFRVAVDNGIIEHTGNNAFCPVDDNGNYTDIITDYAGKYIFDCNQHIIEHLKSQNLVIRHGEIKHQYPYCWRTDKPLIYKLVSSFFVAVTKIKDILIQNNKDINWTPEHIGSGRFHEWLNNVKDWGVSRNRYFGTPIPIWTNEDFSEIVCISNIEELKQLSGINYDIDNIHREFLDNILIPSKINIGTFLKRVPEVLDCWFDSGAVPIAQHFHKYGHYDNFEIPDFITEGIDQTRGWFYTLNVLTSAVFQKPAFKNVICTGLILAEDGHKMSKSKNNFTDPIQIIDKYGADVLRILLVNSPAVKAEESKFIENDLKTITQHLLPLLSALNFYKDYYNLYDRYLVDNNIKNFSDNKNIYSDNQLDRWILSEINKLNKIINIEMKKFQLSNIYKYIFSFIEKLTNIYINLNRDRFKGKYNIDEQYYSLITLNYVLNKLTILSSPFIPFLSEYIYQELKLFTMNDNLSNNLISVFLEHYPSENFELIDVIDTINNLQEIIDCVSVLRSKSISHMSLRIPIKNIIIYGSEQLLHNLNNISNYILSSCNSINFKTFIIDDFVDYAIEPDSKTIGQDFKKLSKSKKYELLSFSKQQINDIINGATINGLSNKHIVVKPFLKSHNINNFYYEYVNNYIIAIDTTYDDEVKEIHIYKLFIRLIQTIREEMNLKPHNKIIVQYNCLNTDNDYLIDVITKFKNDIEFHIQYPIIYVDSINDNFKTKNILDYSININVVVV